MNRYILYDFTDFLNLTHYYEDDPYYIYFNNGYYNLKTKGFNKANTSKLDYKINYEYQDLPGNHPIIIEIKRYMRQVFPRKKEREKVWKMLTHFLTGRTHPNQEGLIYYWIGTGSNSKSLFLRLVMNSLDKYAAKMPYPSYSRIPGRAQPDIIQNKNKRLFSLPTPDGNEMQYLQALKQYTTSDTIVARPLYQGPIHFKLRNHLVFLGDHIPNSRHNRSLNIIRFDSTFCHYPNPNDPLQFQIDPDFSIRYKIDTWKQPFMYLMIQKYNQINQCK